MSAHPEASCIVSSVPPSPPQHGLGDFSSGLRVSSANLIAVCASAKAERRQAPRKGVRHGILAAMPAKPSRACHHGGGSFFCPRAALSALRCGCPPSFSRSCPVRYRVFVQTLSLVFATGCNPRPAQAPLPYHKSTPLPPSIPWSRRPFDLTHTKHTAGMPWTRRLLVVESLLACQ